MRVGAMTLVTLLTSEAATLVRQRSAGFVISGAALQVSWLFINITFLNFNYRVKAWFLFSQVEEWYTPAAPRRRVDRGYIPPSSRHISSFQMEGPSNSSPLPHHLSNLEDFVQRTPGTLVSAEVELRRLCVSQGWGVPSVHLTGQRIGAAGFQVLKNVLLWHYMENVY